MFAFRFQSLVFAVAVGLGVSAPRNADLYIINGDPAPPNSFPWQVSLQKVVSNFWTEKHVHVCGGTLISPSLVVTAAHCIQENAEYRIVAGSNDLQSFRHKIGYPRNITVHPEYDSTIIRNDIAVIKLHRNFTLSPSLMPIQMAENGSLSNCVTSGWGTTSANEDEYPLILRKVKLDLVNQEKCRRLYMDVRDVVIDEKHICAGGNGKAACNGDSGGPLVCLNGVGVPVLTGITSFGVANCGDSHPTVFTRVSTYHDWVLDNSGTILSPDLKFMTILLLCCLYLTHRGCHLSQ
ncbi:chymotrypsin B [Galendromus occidentalis]|uniref:Chymotrypsin B n=1 Tax=Galendromus occidentalis TaxID=34638 RepID=A0AAJ7L7F8_9ACAR|nr:chymotrypsin B [Galendromus occidentalis]